MGALSGSRISKEILMEAQRDADDGEAARREMVAALLASGLGHQDIGERIGRSERTVRRLAAEPDVQAEVAERHREMTVAVTGRLTSLLESAVGAIERGLQDRNPRVRLHAADAAFRHFFRCSNEMELRRELRALRDQLER